MILSLRHLYSSLTTSISNQGNNLVLRKLTCFVIKLKIDYVNRCEYLYDGFDVELLVLLWKP